MAHWLIRWISAFKHLLKGDLYFPGISEKEMKQHRARYIFLSPPDRVRSGPLSMCLSVQALCHAIYRSFATGYVLSRLLVSHWPGLWFFLSAELMRLQLCFEKLTQTVFEKHYQIKQDISRVWERLLPKFYSCLWLRNVTQIQQISYSALRIWLKLLWKCSEQLTSSVWERQ